QLAIYHAVIDVDGTEIFIGNSPDSVILVGYGKHLIKGRKCAYIRRIGSDACYPVGDFGCTAIFDLISPQAEWSILTQNFRYPVILSLCLLPYRVGCIVHSLVPPWFCVFI